MQYLLLIYTDDALLGELADGEFDTMMRGCLQHADALQAAGTLLDSRQLEPAATARTCARAVAAPRSPTVRSRKPRKCWPAST